MPAAAMDGPAGVTLVLAELEMLRRLRAERVAEEPLTAGVAQIEPHRDRALVEQTGAVLVVQSLEQFLHLFKVVVIFRRLAAACRRTACTGIVHGLKDFDLHHMSHVRLRVDGAFANVA